MPKKIKNDSSKYQRRYPLEKNSDDQSDPDEIGAVDRPVSDAYMNGIIDSNWYITFQSTNSETVSNDFESFREQADEDSI